MAKKKKPIEPRYKKCRHKTKILLAYANGVEFVPDDEPFTNGVTEKSGIGSIYVDLTMHYCVRCNQVKDVSAENVPTIEESYAD